MSAIRPVCERKTCHVNDIKLEEQWPKTKLGKVPLKVHDSFAHERYSAKKFMSQTLLSDRQKILIKLASMDTWHAK